MMVDKMIVVDFVIVNYDRHYNNFGAIRNAETLKWITPAPLFDNGSSLWCNQTSANIRVAENAKSQPFFETHEEQIKLVKDFSWLNLDALSDIDEEINEFLIQMQHIDEDRRDAICFALRKRAKAIADYVNSIKNTKCN